MPMPRALLAALLTVSLAACGAGADEPPPLESDITPGVTEPATDTAAGTAPDSPDRPLPGETAVPPTDQPGSEEPGSAPSDEADACGAGKLGRWLNVLPTEDVKREIAATVGERPIRYYTEGDPITMDFNPGRLNAELGADGRIKRFRCG
jgi:hypothetical protein